MKTLETMKERKAVNGLRQFDPPFKEDAGRMLIQSGMMAAEIAQDLGNAKATYTVGKATSNRWMVKSRRTNAPGV